jgi:hypothetical protein
MVRECSQVELGAPSRRLTGEPCLLYQPACPLDRQALQTRDLGEQEPERRSCASVHIRQTRGPGPHQRHRRTLQVQLNAKERRRQVA